MRSQPKHIVLTFSVLVAGAPMSGAHAEAPAQPVADELMTCEFQNLLRDGTKFPGEVNLQITDEFLLWFEPSVLVRSETRAGYEGLRYKILERNEVGVVAVRSSAFSDADVGEVLNARVLTIKRSDGSLRIGSTGTSGAVDLTIGRCK